MFPLVQSYPCHTNVDINCSKMWVLGHEEVLSVSWTGSNPTSHTALMTLCLIGNEKKRRGASPSVREEPFALFLCSAGKKLG